MLQNFIGSFSADLIVYDFLTMVEEGELEKAYDECKVVRKFNSATTSKNIRKYILKDEILDKSYRKLCENYQEQKEKERVLKKREMEEFGGDVQNLPEIKWAKETGIKFTRVDSGEVSPVNVEKNDQNGFHVNKPKNLSHAAIHLSPKAHISILTAIILIPIGNEPIGVKRVWFLKYFGDAHLH